MRMWTASANVVGRRSAHERCRWNWIFRFSDRQTKTRSGADPPNVWPIKPKAFATPTPTLMKTMAEKAGLDNSHLTKYSAQEQEKGMSRILSGSTSMVQTETHSLIKTTKKGSPMLTAAGLFKGNVFYGGNFTINISLSSSPTEAQKQQTYKWIKRIFNDDSPPLT